jgi:hypothetical protein
MPRAILLGLILVTASALVRQPAAAQAPLCPAPAIATLESTRGEWDVTWRDRVAPGRYETTRAHATVAPTAGGCGLLERFEGTREGRPFAALNLIGPAAGDSVQRIWQDSGHGVLLVFGGSSGTSPPRFEWRRDMGERVLRLRHTYLALAPDSFTTQTELSTDDGRTWDIVAHLVYRRR